jgi:type IV secretory pathway protease TraF
MTPTLRPERLVLATSLFGALLPEQVVIFRHKRMELIKRIQKVENGRIFVVGDNSRASIDSRSFGWLPIENVIAKVIWPRLS